MPYEKFDVTKLERLNDPARFEYLDPAVIWTAVGVKDAAFYSYTAPEPQGFHEALVRPETAYYDQQLGEFILLYEEVRRAESPSAALLDFCQTTYEAAAGLGGWDRRALERELYLH